jgi:tetratricopeptide (TPR) repeat protein
VESVEILINKADALSDIGRHKEAAQLLEKALIVEPNNETALSLVVFVYVRLSDYNNAERHCKKYISQYPDESAGHYYMSIIARANAAENQDKKVLKAAKYHIDEAIKLDPYNANYFAVLSAFYIDARLWEEGLEAADEGLSIDPEHLNCLNHRVLCLTKLSRHDELEGSIEDALAQDPHNDYTHSNVGWTKLQQGKPKEAQLYFREALRLDPNVEHARVGMLESIKAQNWLYRQFLNYQFWLSKHKGNRQFAIILGVYVAMRIISSLAGLNILAGFLYAILVCMVYMTWIIEPFSNLFLLFNPFARLALTKDEKTAASIVGVGISIFVIFAVGVGLGYGNLLTNWLIFSLTAIIPLSRYFMVEVKHRTTTLKIYTFGLVMVGAAACVLGHFFDWGSSLFTVYIVGTLIYLFASNYMITQE